jgi:hypothetical protein
MKETLLSVEFWKFTLPIFGATLAWFVNEWRKRLWEQYQRKEASYKELVRCLRGFYIGIGDAEKLKGDFLDQLNQCWLYCPDEVIRKGYAFLDTVHTNQIHADSVKERAMGDFVAAIRKDLLSRKLVRRTNLTGADFRHLSVNRK